MEDDDLAALRAQRLAQMQAKGSAPSGGSGSDEKAQEMEARRQMILAQILEPDAKERLARIALVKPDTARAVEAQLIRQAQTNGIKEKINEAQVKNLLAQVSGAKSSGKISIVRKKAAKREADEEDEDDSWEI